jgi:hypothetical protein
VKAYLYKQTISDSVLDTIHGFQHNIHEIYIPSLKLFFNHAGIFAIHKGRYENAEKIRVFSITFESASYLKQALVSTKKANKLAHDILTSTVKLYGSKK